MAEGPHRRIGLSLLAALALALSACAAGGPAGPDVAVPVSAPDVSDPSTGWARSLTAATGAPVAVSTWGPDAPRAVILALHGFGDRGALTFDAAATAWAEDGIATIAPDQRGFGRNPSRGQWPGAGALVADARGYVRQVRDRFPCVPLVLVGHSMGGGIALAAADGGADALVLAAPAIWGGEALNPLHRMAAWSVAAVVPEMRLSGRGVVRIQASDNIDALRALAADPFYLSPPSAREILGLVRVTDLAAGALGRARQPALLLLGEKDQIVPNDLVERVFADLPGPGRTLRYPDGWHLLFRDVQAPRVWADVRDFVLDVPAPQGCPA